MIDPKDIPHSAVEAAFAAADAADTVTGTSTERMYHAIAAALNDMLGEPVGWQILANKGRYGWEPCTQEGYEDTIRTGRYLGLDTGTKDVQVRAVYAIKKGDSHE
jgi:hypothetical protein